jgi:flagellar biosynthesis/type III secretory pathway protein FliH
MEFIDLIGPKRLLKDYDESWTFEAEPAITAGCIVESSAGQIDFQLDAAWNRIKDNVLKAVR